MTVNGWLRRRRGHKQVLAAQTSTTPVVNAGVTIADLRSAITRLLDAAEARFGAELELPEDFYWNVSLVDATQIDDDPQNDMGSVADDIESVREFLARDASEYVSIWHEADHLAGVLRAIARLDLASGK